MHAALASLRSRASAAPTTVLCANSIHKYFPETVGKGCYEVIGTLQSDNSISSMNATSMGDSLDMDMYAEMVTLTHQFPDLF